MSGQRAQEPGPARPARTAVSYQYGVRSALDQLDDRDRSTPETAAALRGMESPTPTV